MSNALSLFSSEWVQAVFPQERADAFFEALFGGAEEGAYDIALRFVKSSGSTYEFAFDLIQRPGMCLVCNLTHGLPQVFSRHPVINAKGVVLEVAKALGKDPAKVQWQLQQTRQVSEEMHSIPFILTVGE